MLLALHQHICVKFKALLQSIFLTPEANVGIFVHLTAHIASEVEGPIAGLTCELSPRS